MTNIKIEQVKITDLTFAEYNPRKLTDIQFNDIKKSIETFGFIDPVIANKHKDRLNVIIGGHQRVRVAKKLGYKTIPVVFIELILKKEQELNIRLNKNSGDWDWDILANEFDIEDLGEWGFTEDDFSPLGDVDEIEETEGDDDIPEQAPPITVKGDLYELGEHRVLCGDSTLIDDVDKLMDGNKADMVFTDPPYNINFKPQRGTHGIIKNDNMSDDDFEKFLSDVFAICKTILKEDTYLISFMGWSTITSFNKALEDLFKIKSMPIWVKNNFGIGYYTRPKYEPFYLCLNGEPEKPTSPPADVFEFPRVHKTIHSCEKPIALIVDIIKHFVGKGLIYEPFAGSGSTLIACEKTNRKCYGMELDEKYCDVVVKRYVSYCKKNNKPYSVKRNGEVCEEFE